MKLRKIVKNIPLAIPVYRFIYYKHPYGDKFASSSKVFKRHLSQKIKRILRRNEYINYYIASDIVFDIRNLRVFSIDEDVKHESSLVIIHYTIDTLALPVLEYLIEEKIRFKPIGYLGSPKKSSRFSNFNILETLKRTQLKSDRTSHLNNIIHENICQALEYTRELEGDYVEVGVYKGGSAYSAMTYCDISSIDRRFYLIDTFDGFNYEEARISPDIIWKDTHKLFGVNETMDYLGETFSEYTGKYSLIPLNIIKGDLPKEIVKIAVANIDVDLYEATYEALVKISRLMVRGGVIICEDPKSTPYLYGAYYAMEKFLTSDLGSDYRKLDMIGQYFLIKQ